MVQFLESSVHTCNKEEVARPKKGQNPGNPNVSVIQKNWICDWVTSGSFELLAWSGHTVVLLRLLRGYSRFALVWKPHKVTRGRDGLPNVAIPSIIKPLFAVAAATVTLVVTAFPNGTVHSVTLTPILRFYIPIAK